MMKKRAVMGVGLMTMYHLVLVSLVAFAVFGISAVFYTYKIDVKKVEAKLINRGLAECLFETGEINLDHFSKADKEKILSYCGYSDSIEKRVYAQVEFYLNSNDQEPVEVLSQGDSGKGWFGKLKNVAGKGSYKELFPREYSRDLSVKIIGDGKENYGLAKINVLVVEE